MFVVFIAAVASVHAAPLALELGLRELFVDDHNVQSHSGVERVMHHPLKKGAVIRPWGFGNMTGACQTRSVPQWNPVNDRWELLVGDCDPNDKATGAPAGLAYPAQVRWMYSKDLVQWGVGPLLNVPASCEPTFMVIIDPTAPASTMYKTIVPYNAGDPDAPPQNNTLSGLYTSADGVAWEKVPGGQNVPTEDEQNLSFDRRTGTFYYTVKRTAYQHHNNRTWHSRAVALATTTDFAGKWKDYGLVFASDEEDQRVGRLEIEARIKDPTLMQPWAAPDPSVWNTDVYNMGVFRYESVYIGMPAFYHWVGPAPNTGGNTDGFHLIKLATSRDLTNWTRLGNREAFIEPSHLGAGAYDLLQMLPPSDVLVRGDELWMYYSCLKDRDQPAEPASWARDNPDRGAVCMATLRRDGFISLAGGPSGGTVTTTLLHMPTNGARRPRLFVNVDASAGSLGVELLAPTADRTLAIAPAASTTRVDSVKLELELAAPDSAAPFELQPATPYRLRFKVGAGVHLFSYWVE